MPDIYGSTVGSSYRPIYSSSTFCSVSDSFLTRWLGVKKFGEALIVSSVTGLRSFSTQYCNTSEGGTQTVVIVVM